MEENGMTVEDDVQIEVEGQGIFAGIWALTDQAIELLWPIDLEEECLE